MSFGLLIANSSLVIGFQWSLFTFCLPFVASVSSHVYCNETYFPSLTYSFCFLFCWCASIFLFELIAIFLTAKKFIFYLVVILCDVCCIFIDAYFCANLFILAKPIAKAILAFARTTYDFKKYQMFQSCTLLWQAMIAFPIEHHRLPVSHECLLVNELMTPVVAFMCNFSFSPFVFIWKN